MCDARSTAENPQHTLQPPTYEQTMQPPGMASMDANDEFSPVPGNLGTPVPAATPSPVGQNPASPHAEVGDMQPNFKGAPQFGQTMTPRMDSPQTSHEPGDFEQAAQGMVSDKSDTVSAENLPPAASTAESAAMSTDPSQDKLGSTTPGRSKAVEDSPVDEWESVEDDDRKTVSEDGFTGNTDTRATINCNPLDDEEDDDDVQVDSNTVVLPGISAPTPITKTVSSKRPDSAGSSDSGSSEPMSQQPEFSWNVPLRVVDSPASENVAENRFVDYSLKAELGRGGMGIVYSAEQTAIHRNVAFKQVKGKSSRKRQKKSRGLLTEAIITGDLAHPNIVPIHDLGQDAEGNLFYSMKRVEGTPWNKTIRGLSEAENISIFLHVADAIAFAHSRGVIHRDLKPENVMVGEYGEVLLMDWGLAQVTPDFSKRNAIERTPNHGGSPAYMAPEEAANFLVFSGWEPGDLVVPTPATDIYLLGAILYEIVTGHPPHSGIDQPTCIRNAAKNVIVPTNDGGELVEIALKAMATDRDDRYASAVDLQKAVRGYQDHLQSIKLGQQAEKHMNGGQYSRAVVDFENALNLWDENPLAKTRIRVAQRRVSRRRMAGISSFVAFVTSVAIGFFWIDAERQIALDAEGRTATALEIAKEEKSKAELASDQAIAAREDAIASEKVAVAASIEARKQEEKAKDEQKKAVEAEVKANVARVAARAEELNADRAAVNANAAKRKQQYESFVASMQLAESRIEDNVFGEAVKILNDIRDQRTAMIKDSSARVAELKQAISNAEAKRGAAATNIEQLVQNIEAALLDDKEQLTARLTDEEKEQSHFQEKLSLLNQELELATQEVFNLGFEWRRLWYVCNQGYVEAKAAGPLSAVAAHPNQTFFAYGGVNGNVTVTSFAHDAKGKITFKVEQTLEGDQPVRCLAFSTDGATLAVGRESPEIDLWDWATAKRQRQLKGHTAAVLAIKFATYGDTIVSTSKDSSIRLWNSTSESSIASVSWLKTEEYALDVDVWTDTESEIGMFIAAAGTDSAIKIWDVTTEQTEDNSTKKSLKYKGQFEGHIKGYDDGQENDATAVAISPDGHQAVSGGKDGRILMWNPKDVQADEKKRKFEGLQDLIKGPKTEKKKVQISKAPEFTALEHLHKRAVNTLEFAEIDGELRLISGGEDTVIHVWDMSEKKIYRTLRGHGEQVKGCQLAHGIEKGSPIILSASLDATARLWDFRTYEETRMYESEFKDNEGIVRAAVFDPNGSGRFVSGGGTLGGTVSVRTMAQNTRTTSTQSGTDLTRADFAAALRDGPHAAEGKTPLLVTGETGIARIWNLHKGTQVARLTGLGYGSLRVPVAISENQQWILTAANGPGALLWNVDDVLATAVPVVAKRLIDSDPKSAVMACGISEDGKIGLTGDNDGKCHVWNLETGEVIRTVIHRGETRAVHGDYIKDVALFSDGSFLTANAREIRRWSQSGETRKILVRRAREAVESMVLSQDEKYIVSTWSGDLAGKAVVIYDIANEEIVFDRVIPIALSAKFHPTQQKVLVASGVSKANIELAKKNNVKLDVETLHPVQEFVFPDKAGNLEPKVVVKAGDAEDVNFANYSSDGRFIFTIRRKVVRMRDAISGNEIRTFEGPRRVNSVGFSGDGKYVITGNGDGSVRILNPDNGKEILKQAKLPGEVRVAKFRPLAEQFQYVTNCADNSTTVWSWDPATETVAEIAKLPEANKVAYASDGSRLLTVEAIKKGEKDVKVILRDATDPSKALGELLIEPGWSVTSVSFFREKRQMIGVGLKSDRAVKAIVWWPDVSDGEATKTVRLEGHAGEIRSIAFAKDGSRVVTGSADRKVKIWDPETGRELLTLKGHKNDVTAVDFSYDGNTVMSAGEDGRIMLWFATPEEQ